MTPSIPLPLEPAVWPHPGTSPDFTLLVQDLALSCHGCNNRLSHRLSTSRSVCRVRFPPSTFVRPCQLIPPFLPHLLTKYTSVFTHKWFCWKAACNMGQKTLMLPLTQGWLLAGSHAWDSPHPAFPRRQGYRPLPALTLEDVARPSTEHSRVCALALSL